MHSIENQELYNYVSSMCVWLLGTCNQFGIFILTICCVFRYLYLSRLVTLPGASGALLRLVLDQVTLVFSNFSSQIA